MDESNQRLKLVFAASTGVKVKTDWLRVVTVSMNGEKVKTGWLRVVTVHCMSQSTDLWTVVSMI